MNLTKILVPLDGSALAEMAIPTAVGLAKDKGASLMLMRAAEAAPSLSDVVAAQVDVVREAEGYLEQMAVRLRADGCGRVETCVWYGAPASSIVEAVKAYSADLVVMTSHGRSGIGRLILGSVAESVLRGTSAPILLLRAKGAAVLPPAGPAKRAEASHV